MSDTWAQLATLAVALLCFQLGEVLHGSGFVAAFVGGFAFATIARHVGTSGADAVSPTPRRSCSSSWCSLCSADTP